MAYHEVLDPGSTPLKSKLLHELRKVNLDLDLVIEASTRDVVFHPTGNCRVNEIVSNPVISYGKGS